MVKVIKIVFLFFVILLIFIFSLELFARFKKPAWHTIDPNIGWKLKNNFSHTYKNYDQEGKVYYSKFETNNDGLRIYGNKNSKIRIFVIGDSFTAEPYSGNNEMWFAHLSKKIKKHTKKDTIVYAGGGGGYSTLQEFLLLEEINKKYKFDIFILQFCSNDFGSNLFEAETSGNNFNQFFKRPYLNESGDVIFYDSFFAKLFRTKIIGESRFFNKVLFIYSRYKKNKKIDDNKKDIIEKKAFIKTGNLLTKMRSIIKLDNAYMVSCSDNASDNKLNKNWKLIASDSGFIPLDLPNKTIDTALKKNSKIFFSDLGHFNNYGNKLFGEAVFEQLLDYQKFNF
jgi:lysophospholipase L1-like esterase